MMHPANRPANEAWPELRYEDWRPTCETLHRWIQIIGKIRLAQTPWHIHSWHATLYLTTRGLTTSPIPHGDRFFEIELDFVDHAAIVRTNRGDERRMPLKAQSVADFHAALFDMLEALGLHVRIHGSPNEMADAIPFADDRVHASYDADYANRFWGALLQVDSVFKAFRTAFLGKVSPVHLFWGSFDLAVTRFSGRRAPLHPGGIPNLPDRVTQEAYSHEVSSAGFWPGGGPVDYAAFYSYAYPAPTGFGDAAVRPADAFYSDTAGEFLLPYEAVRTAVDPAATLWAFLESTYEAAANSARWDRAALECPAGRPRIPRPLNPPSASSTADTERT
jgi:hypothetical protein